MHLLYYTEKGESYPRALLLTLQNNNLGESFSKIGILVMISIKERFINRYFCNKLIILVILL